MKKVVLVAKNEEACRLFDCLLAYKKLVEPSSFSSSNTIVDVPYPNLSTPELAAAEALI